MRLPVSRRLSLLLAACILLSCISGCGFEGLFFATLPGDVPSSGTTQPGHSTVAPTDPQPTEPQPTEPQPTEPQPTEPQPTEPQPTEPQPTEPQPTEPQPTEPQPTEPQPTEPQPTEPKPTEPKPTEPKPTEPKPTEPKPTEPKPTEPKPTEPQPTDPPVLEIPELKAQHAFVYDARTNEFLYNSSNLVMAVYPASVTKMFTTYVALQHLQMDEQVVVGKELSYVAKDASVAGLKKGETLTVEALVYCTLLPSGCDASYVLATAAGRKLLDDPDASYTKAVEAFMDECNRLAKELGMKNSNFVNPDGYHHKDHYISLQALAMIGSLCMADGEMAEIMRTYSATVTYLDANGKQGSFKVHNSNKTIYSQSPYYHSKSLGGKTGYTEAAGGCLINAYQVGDSFIVVGVFGCPDWDSRYEDANALFETFAPIL